MLVKVWFPTCNSCFLEGWRRCLHLHWCLTSARVIPDPLDITTCRARSSAHSSQVSSTAGCFTGRRHTRERRDAVLFLPRAPLCRWVACACTLPCAGADPTRPGPPCPAVFGGSSAAHRARLAAQAWAAAEVSHTFVERQVLVSRFSLIPDVCFCTCVFSQTRKQTKNMVLSSSDSLTRKW